METIFSKQVGERVAAARAALGLTQAELARGLSERLGREIRPLTVTRLEGAKRPIVIDELKAAADVLKVSLTDLLDVETGVAFEHLVVVGAAEEKSRATHRLTAAVREWLSAEKVLSDLYRSQAREDLARLPGSTQMFVVKMFKSMDFDQIVDDARRDWSDWSKEHDATP